MAAQVSANFVDNSPSSSREYGNPFPDFQPGAPNCYFDNESYHILPIFLEQLKGKAEQILQDLVEACNTDSSPGNSVYTGSSGIALLFMFASKRLSKHYIEEAKAVLKRACAAMKGHRISFLNGDPGPLALSVMVNNGTADSVDALSNVMQSQQSQVNNPLFDVPDEILYGRAGYLYSMLYINKYFNPEFFSSASIKNVIGTILTRGRNLAMKEKYSAPLMYEWHDKNYFGAAHGTAGIMYLLLQAKDCVSEEDMEKLIRPTIDNLMKLQFPSGNIPSSAGNSTDRLVQWCHGAPGIVQLFCEAFKVFHDERYLHAALQCGEVVWSRGLLKKGCSLCHGAAGNAYTFLSLYQLTNSLKEFSAMDAAKHLYRACVFADWCLDYRKHRNRLPDRPLSLFEGKAGIAYFLLDMFEPQHAAFPGYTV